MLDIMADHVFILRVEGERYRLAYCNDAMDTFMNPERNMLFGRYLDEIVPDSDLYQRISEKYSRALAAGHMIRYEENTEGFGPAPLTVFETSLSPEIWCSSSSASCCAMACAKKTWSVVGVAKNS